MRRISVRMPRRLRPGKARIAALAGAAVLVLTVTGCASPTYRFVGSDDHDLVLKIPRSWNVVNTDDVLKASGVDPAQRQGWMIFYDASSKPSVQHLRTNTAKDPVLIAQSFDIAAAQRASVTDDELRNAVLPVTAEARAAAKASLGTATAATAATDDGFKLISDRTLNSKTEHGVHVVFSYSINGTNEFFDQVAVTDPKKTRGHLVVVHCTETCFDANSSQIGVVVSSLTLKTH